MLFGAFHRLERHAPTFEVESIEFLGTFLGSYRFRFQEERKRMLGVVQTAGGVNAWRESVADAVGIKFAIPQSGHAQEGSQAGRVVRRMAVSPS